MSYSQFWRVSAPLTAIAAAFSQRFQCVEDVDREKQSGLQPKQPLALGDRAYQVLVCTVLGGVSKIIMQVLNHTECIDTHKLLDVLDASDRKRGVLTVCNHVSAVDDPGAVAAMLPLSWFLTPEKVRWTICATDRCFKNAVTTSILSHGRVLPIERGKGLHQPMMDDVIGKLSQGDWVHMFPEGTRSRSSTAALQSIKLGVGRMVTDPTVCPLVVPFVHDGMDTILKVGDWIPVNVGQQLRILVGDPIDFQPMVDDMRREGKTDRDIHVAIAERIKGELTTLQIRLHMRKRATSS